MARIKMLTGVVEVGLFCHMAKAAYFGNKVHFGVNHLVYWWSFSDLMVNVGW